MLLLPKPRNAKSVKNTTAPKKDSTFLLPKHPRASVGYNAYPDKTQIIMQGLSLIRTFEKKRHSYIFVHFRTYSYIFVLKKKPSLGDLPSPKSFLGTQTEHSTAHRHGLAPVW